MTPGPLLTTYLAGGHREAWAGVRETNDAGPPWTADAGAVARETMRRGAYDLDLIVSALRVAGWRFAEPETALVPPEPDVAGTLAAVAARLGGPVPLALEAFLTAVGYVDLRGTHPALDPPLYAFGEVLGYPDLADPLSTAPAWWLLSDLVERDSDDWIEEKRPYPFSLAPDELHKANISGSTHDILLPDRDPDPVLHGVRERPGVRLVEYLRTSLAWAGFPGYEFLDRPLPQLLGEVRPRLLPI